MNLPINLAGIDVKPNLWHLTINKRSSMFHHCCCHHCRKGRIGIMFIPASSDSFKLYLNINNKNKNGTRTDVLEKERSGQISSEARKRTTQMGWESENIRNRVNFFECVRQPQSNESRNALLVKHQNNNRRKKNRKKNHTQPPPMTLARVLRIRSDLLHRTKYSH